MKTYESVLRSVASTYAHKEEGGDEFRMMAHDRLDHRASHEGARPASVELVTTDERSRVLGMFGCSSQFILRSFFLKFDGKTCRTGKIDRKKLGNEVLNTCPCYLW